MKLRPGVPDDADAIAALVGSFQPELTDSPDGAGAEAYLASVTSEAERGYLASDRYRYVVAEGDDGTLIGFIALRDQTHLFHLFVARAHQRAGIARRLWQEARATAPRRFTVNSSLRAVPAYRAFGFEPAGDVVSVHGISFQPMRLDERSATGAIEAMHSRRSIRAYEPHPVPRALIEDLLWAAVQAPIPPVSGNEPWAIVVVEGRDRLEAYGERARQHADAHQPAGRPWAWTTRPGFKVFWGAPALVLLCARAGSPEAVHDCVRAGQNLVIAAHAAGLGSCWVGAPMPWLALAEVQRELGVPEGFAPAVAITLGFAAEQPAGNPKPRPAIHWHAP